MKIKRYIATVTAIILCLLALALSACGTGLKTVKVTFDYNDGATPDKIVEVEQGSTVEKPKPPTRDGHIFVGWYLDGEEYDFGEAVNSDVTLTAEWEENDHVVTIIIYDGNTVKRTVSDGEKVKAPDVPEREGFEFDGWYSDENFTKEYNFDSPVKNDFTIYGKWKDVSVTYYKVTYNYNYEGAIPNSTSVEEGSKAVKPATDPVFTSYSSPVSIQTPAVFVRFTFTGKSARGANLSSLSFLPLHFKKPNARYSVFAPVSSSAERDFLISVPAMSATASWLE